MYTSGGEKDYAEYGNGLPIPIEMEGSEVE